MCSIGFPHRKRVGCPPISGGNLCGPLVSPYRNRVGRHTLSKQGPIDAIYIRSPPLRGVWGPRIFRGGTGADSFPPQATHAESAQIGETSSTSNSMPPNRKGHRADGAASRACGRMPHMLRALRSACAVLVPCLQGHGAEPPMLVCLQSLDSMVQPCAPADHRRQWIQIQSQPCAQ